MLHGHVFVMIKAKLHAELPEDRGTKFHINEPPRGKINNVVSEQIRHKPACTATELEILELSRLRRNCTIRVAKTRR